MLKQKILGALVLLGTLTGTSTAMAGAPAFAFPPANQCIQQTNSGQMTFAVFANTNSEQCREAYRRTNGVEVIITGTVTDKKTWRNQNISTREILRPGRVAHPRLRSVYSGTPGGQLNAKDYSLIGAFHVSTRWVH